MIDGHLQWESHIDSLTKKLRYLLYIFSKLTSFLNKKLLLTMYRTLFLLVLQYGILAWGGAYDNVFNSIEVLHRKLLKTIFKKNLRYPSRLLFEEEDLFNTKCIFVYIIRQS